MTGFSPFIQYSEKEAEDASITFSASIDCSYEATYRPNEIKDEVHKNMIREKLREGLLRIIYKEPKDEKERAKWQKLHPRSEVDL